MVIAGGFFIERPQRFGFPFPDFVGEGVFERVDHGFYTVIHVAEGLVRVEVAPRPCEGFVFEESLVAQASVEDEA